MTPNQDFREQNRTGPRSPYPTDLTDEEWAVLEPLAAWSARRGRPRTWPVRRVWDVVFYVLRSGCAWRLLPRDFPPWETVFYHFRRWRLAGLWHRLHEALREATRRKEDRHPDASAAVMDSQSVRMTEESGGISGYDAAKGVKGRKRHLLVDTTGLVLSSFVTPAGTQDRDGACRLLAGLKPREPRLARIWADGAYSGRALAEWCEECGGWTLEVVKKRDGAEGFEVLPRRWVVERTFAWLGRQRRLSKDYERKVQTSEAMIQIAMSRLMLARLARAP
jgi:putative transposase